MTRGGRKGLSIFYRLLLAFLGVVFLISGVLTAFFYVFHKRVVETNVKEQVLGEISSIRKSFRYYYQENLVKDLRLLASNPKLNDYITSSPLERDTIAPSVEKLFVGFIANNPGYMQITFVNALGREVIKADRTGAVRIYGKMAETDLFKRIEAGASESVHVGQIRIDGSAGPAFTIGIYKTDDDIGQFGGAVMVDCSLEPFLRYLEGTRILGENPVWAIGPDGSVLGRPKSRATAFDPSLYLYGGVQEIPHFTAVREGILAFEDLSILPGQPFLRIALTVPETLLLKDTRATAKFLLLICLLSFVLAFLLALYLSGHITKPIIELAAASGQLAGGNLSAPVDVETTGEVRMLVDSFNRMADDLKKTTVSKDYVDSIIHSMADGLIVLGRDLTIRTVNRAMVELSGYREEELVGRRFEMLIAEEAVPDAGEFVREGLVKNRELVFRTKEGALIPVLISGSAIAGKRQEIVEYVVIGKDITERKRAEEALREAGDRLRATLRASPAAIMTLDPDGIVTLWNEAAERIFGWRREEIVGHFNPTVPEDKLDEFRKTLEFVVQGGTFCDLQLRRKKKDGTPVDISFSTAPLHDAEGKVVGVMGIMNDITAQKKLEEELSRVQKLESLGILAGGIAHDFNNILTAILGYISLAKTTGPRDLQRDQLLMEAEKASLRAKDLTHQLLTFSRGGSPVKKTIAIPEVLGEAANFALRGSNVRCGFHVAGDLWPVDADEGQLSQVVHNLVINAVQSMPEGGVIRIGAENVSLGPEERIPLPEGRYVKVSIEDQGIGIPGENLPKIFDPYFTTKKKGSGLGLAIAYSIVRNHGGHIRVDSSPGIGTTVTFHLPGSEKRRTEEAAAREEVVAGKGRILVMDDEEMVRDVVGEMLKKTGYEVAYARDGVEAIDMYVKARESPRPFHAVIMDLTIPGGMGGKETIRKLRAIDPDIKAVVSSGYSNDPVMANFREYGFNAVISKPFRGADLSRTLQAVTREPVR